MATRDYQTDEIAVHWDSSRCVHSGICLRSLHQVFNLRQRPWVDVEAAPADDIAAAIEKCPSGALSYTRPGETGEAPPEITTVIPSPDGPLYVRGDVEVRDSEGDLMAAGYRMTLCRCGHSKNQPFCDLSHRDAGFRDNPHAIDRRRKTAESPGDVDA